MSIDVARAIGAVTREVKARQVDGREVRVLVATRSYATDQEDLWDALTNPERIPRWFLPISGDLQLGGEYHLDGNASGKITACEAPRHLGLDWGSAPHTSWVEITLSEAPDGGTNLRLEHTALYTEETWAQFGPGAAGVGWDPALLGLQEHFEDVPALTPEQGPTWHETKTGRAYFRQSSDAWRQADIDFGTDPEAAAEAAERSRAFYTGDVSPEEGGGES